MIRLGRFGDESLQACWNECSGVSVYITYQYKYIHELGSMLVLFT